MTTLKPLTVWITTNWGKFLKEMKIADHLIYLPRNLYSASRETCIQDKKQQLDSYMEQQTCSKLEKEYIKAVYCHPAYLTYIQSTSCKIPGWIKHKLESRLLGEISNFRYADDTTLVGRTKEPLDEGERGE